MKKLLNILFVKRAEVENKWWHRLSNVIIFGSAITVFILTIITTIDNIDFYKWSTYKPVAFSLESNYDDFNGKELPCQQTLNKFSPKGDLDFRFIITCEGVDIPLEDSKLYITLYKEESNNLTNKFGLDRYNDDCPDFNNSSVETIFNCLKEKWKQKELDPSYPEYKKELDNLARIKVYKEFNTALIFRDIARLVFIPIFISLIWVIFWNSVFYRVILYIVFGKKK